MKHLSGEDVHMKGVCMSEINSFTSPLKCKSSQRMMPKTKQKVTKTSLKIT